jgi:predicted HAD superfamily Cof-like phosphohydrolase
MSDDTTYTNFERVKTFHRAMKVLVGDRPSFPSEKTLDLRHRLIEEEYQELCDAIEKRDMVEVADAIGDLLYVVNGFAVTLGIDIDPIFVEIHRTNMKKHPDGKRADGKIIKPEGWEPPRIKRLLEKQGWEG